MSPFAKAVQFERVAELGYIEKPTIAPMLLPLIFTPLMLNKVALPPTDNGSPERT